MKKIIFILMLFISFSASAKEDYSQYYFTGKFGNYIKDETDSQRPTNFNIYNNLAYLSLDSEYDYKTQKIPNGKYLLVTDKGTKISFKVQEGIINNLKIISSIQQMKNNERLNFEVNPALIKKGVTAACSMATHIAEWHYLNIDNNFYTLVKYYEPSIGNISVISDNSRAIGAIKINLDSTPSILNTGHINLSLDTSDNAVKYYQNNKEYLLSAHENSNNDTILEIDGCKIIKYNPEKIKNITR